MNSTFPIMSNILPFESPADTTNCLRCGKLCRRGTPDMSKQAIRQAHGGEVPAQLQPEIFLDSKWRESVLRPVMKTMLAHTQLPEDAIDWINVVSNWGMPFPKGREPGLLL